MKQSSTATGRGQKKPGNNAASSRNSGARSDGSGNRSASSGSRSASSGSRSASSGSRSASSGSRSASSGSRSADSENGNGGMRANSDSSTSSSSRGNANTANNNNGSDSSSSRASGKFEGQSHLEKFFLDQLKDIYYAEQKIVQSLPKMQEAATTSELKEAFEDHLHQTQRHVKRLEKAFETLGQKAEGKKCEAIEGIAREVDNIIGETEEGTLTRDAALIIAAQKVEHYEIATYGGLVQLAITMQLHDAADLLDKTLVEEEDTDARLTEIAENEINLRAEHEDNQYSWDANSSSEGSQGQDQEEQEDEDVDEESSSV